MTVTEAADPDRSGSAVADAAPAGPPQRRSSLRWWREVLYILAFYLVYTGVRNTQGSASVSAAHAFRNARRVIHLERLLGLYHEASVQHAVVGARWFISFWDVFYGTAHFVVTAAALVWLYRRFPDVYPRWRNTLAVTTALALIGFTLFPLMPPRLLPSSYHFVDTLRDVGGLWSFDSGAMQKVSNQYAAMPSLHFGWATWCTAVLVPRLQTGWKRTLAVAYPLLTLFAIVVTANHYVLDAVGGLAVFGIGWLVARAIDRRSARRAGPAEDAVALTQ